MGCGTSAAHIRSNAQVDLAPKLHEYSISVKIPSTGGTEKFSLQIPLLPIPLTSLMNMLAFDSELGKSLDANFISVFRKDLDTFEYLVQRLCGVELENEEDPREGKQWVSYINKQFYEWNEVCEKEIEVNPGDLIEWRFKKDERE